MSVDAESGAKVRRSIIDLILGDDGTLCDLFAGCRHPTFGTLRAICKALGLALEEVIQFKKEAGTPTGPEVYE